MQMEGRNEQIVSSALSRSSGSIQDRLVAQDRGLAIRIAYRLLLHEVDAPAEQTCKFFAQIHEIQRAPGRIGAEGDQQVDIAVSTARISRDGSEDGQLQYSPASTKVGQRFSRRRKDSVHDVCPGRHYDTAREFDLAVRGLTCRTPVFIARDGIAFPVAPWHLLAAENMLDRPRAGVVVEQCDAQQDIGLAGMLGDELRTTD